MEKVYVSVSTDPVKSQCLEKDVPFYASEVLEAGADFLHCDIMDGNFVPAKTYDEKVVQEINKNCLIPLDVHLMIKNPQKKILDYKNAGANFLTIHYESFKCKFLLGRTLKKIRKEKMLSGLSINPNTKVEQIEKFLKHCDLVLVMSVEPGKSGQKFLENAYEKVEKLNKIKQEKKLNFKIEVDGGITPEISEKLIKKGANIIVSGSFVFNNKNKKEAINSLKK